jgi:hypothetical protein
MADDVYVYDRATKGIERVSIASDGTLGEKNSVRTLTVWSPSISADGRYVAYTSNYPNLVPGDTNGKWDAFVYDRQSHTTERVVVTSNEAQDPQGGSSIYSVKISADGRYVVFASTDPGLVAGDTNNAADVFLFDRVTRSTELLSMGTSSVSGNGGDSFRPSISADGRFVAFSSAASDLVNADTNNAEDAFVYDRQTHTMTRVSVASDGSQGYLTSNGALISEDGQHVVFTSYAPNLVTGDTNNAEDAFSYDMNTKVTKRLSVASDGTQSTGGTAVSTNANAQYSVFYGFQNFMPSCAGEISGSLFIHEALSGETACVDLGNVGNPAPSESISADGSLIAYIAGQNDLYVVRNPLVDPIPPADTIAPTTSFTIATSTGTGFATYWSPATLQFPADDNVGGSGVDKTLYSLDYGPWLEYASTTPVTVTSVGNHSVRFYSIDHAGNQGVQRAMGFTVVAPPAPPTPVVTDKKNATISGTVFEDKNGNGKKDRNEDAVSHATVYIDANNNGRLDRKETSVETNKKGEYQFDHLSAGTYTIRQIVETGWKQNTPSGGAYTVTLVAAQKVANEDFSVAKIKPRR